MKTSLLMVCILLLVSADLCDMQSCFPLNVSKLVVRLNSNASHIKKSSEVLTAVARCSLVEGSDVSRSPLSLFHGTLTVLSYA